ncbi:hypothetical protein ACWDTG_06805 [Rhodococcus zopfii]
MTVGELTMHDLNAAISLAMEFLGPDAFTEDEDGNVTWSDAAVEIARAHFAILEVEP